MIKSIFLILVFAMTLPASADWTPPDNPDPQVILQEARTDAMEKRYEDALAKHLWFHRNALKLEPGLYGVRLSFALSYWEKLGRDYPPALAKLKSIREDARKSVIEQDSKEARQAFHEFKAISQTLNEDSETNALFVRIDKERSPIAQDLFNLALPSLIKAKEYKLCGKYLQPKSDFENSKKVFHANVRLAKDPKIGDRLKDIAENRFTNDIATLVALLVINDRKPEAVEIAAQAKKEWSNEPFHEALDRAVEGVVPMPAR